MRLGASVVVVPGPALEPVAAGVVDDDDPLLAVLELDALLLGAGDGVVDDWVEVVLGAGVECVVVASGSMYC